MPFMAAPSLVVKTSQRTTPTGSLDIFHFFSCWTSPRDDFSPTCIRHFSSFLLIRMTGESPLAWLVWLWSLLFFAYLSPWANLSNVFTQAFRSATLAAELVWRPDDVAQRLVFVRKNAQAVRIARSVLRFSEMRSIGCDLVYRGFWLVFSFFNNG